MATQERMVRMEVRTIKRAFYGLLATTGVLLSLMALFLLSVTAQNSTEFDRLHNVLIGVNIAGAFVLFLLLLGNLIRLVREYRENVPGARLKTRIVGNVRRPRRTATGHRLLLRRAVHQSRYRLLVRRRDRGRVNQCHRIGPGRHRDPETPEPERHARGRAATVCSQPKAVRVRAEFIASQFWRERDDPVR